MIFRPLALAFLLLVLGSGMGRAAEIEPFQRGSYAALLQAAAGKPMVVHFWSITCAPCLAEMPRLAELQKANPDLALVMVATDPIEAASRIGKALARYGLAGVPNMAFADAFTERLLFEVDRSWRGELPKTIFVGREGSVKTVTGPIQEDFVKEWLIGQRGDDGTRRDTTAAR